MLNRTVISCQTIECHFIKIFEIFADLNFEHLDKIIVLKMSICSNNINEHTESNYFITGKYIIKKK